MKRLMSLFIPLLLIAVIASAQDLDEPPHPFTGADGLLVMAHQGGDGIRPSSTFGAYQHAAELGADVLEIDIHSTADGVLVVIHDATVDRTSDGTGYVNELTLAELQALDFGYHWPTLQDHENPPEVDGYPYRGQGYSIATLEEILQAFPDHLYNIEIKQITPSITAPLCEMLRDYELTPQVLVASFHQEVIEEFREVCPEVVTSAVESEIRTFLLAVLRNQLDDFQTDAVAFQVPEFFGNLRVVSAEFVQAAQANGIAVHVWTVNDAEAMQRMIDYGVDGIITDYPDVLLDLLGRADS